MDTITDNRGLAPDGARAACKGPVMQEAITWVGIDAHAKSLQFAVHRDGQWQQGDVPNESKSVRRVAKKLVRQAPGEVRCCYEAGPTGYALGRELEAAAPELVCEVIAPSLIPVKSGERIKTDRRDARKLAQYLEAGLLTEVHPPTEEQEAARDLTRCRRAMKGDLMRARHRLSKLLLRRGIRYSAGKKAWTQAYHKWLGTLVFAGVDKIVFEQYVLVVEQLMEHIAHIDRELKRIVRSNALLVNHPPLRRRITDANPSGSPSGGRGATTIVASSLSTVSMRVSRLRSPWTRSSLSSSRIKSSKTNMPPRVRS